MPLSSAERVSRKQSGAHYTPEGLASFVARQVLGALGSSISTRLRVLDPAVGDGALLSALAKEMPQQQRASWDWTGFDISQNALDSASANTSGLTRIEYSKCDFLDYAVPLVDTPQLFGTEPPELFDVVISNPPYVRTQVLGADRAQALATRFGLRGRVDLSFAFLVAIQAVLKPGGVAGVIVSNRFLTTRAGEAVRDQLSRSFDILHVWDLGDTRLFDAAVLPAVLLLRRRQDGYEAPTSRMTSVYLAAGAAKSRTTESSLFAALESESATSANSEGVEIHTGTLSIGHPSQPWRVSSPTVDEWLSIVEKHSDRRFGDLGTIRVGIKTTADSIFIRDDWHTLSEGSEPELLRPLTTHRVARRFRAQTDEAGPKVLYTHEVYGGKRRPVDLDCYPRSKAYLDSHRAALASRKYVLDAGRLWYEIWVPQNPETWKERKIVFRDIAERPTFWMDDSGSVVNGDCYWLTLDSGLHPDWLWLALAVANSTFALEYYDRKFNNRLYAGRRRFLSQYVEQFPLPDLARSESVELVGLARTAFDLAGTDSYAEIESKIDAAVLRAFGF